MNTTLKQGCDACNKSVLSLLLLRPSPIANEPLLAPVGSGAVNSADGFVDGLVPERKPTESRYVLRLLRAGYVYVYIPSPPPGVRNWLVYRVRDNADLIAQTDPVFAQNPLPPRCGTVGHNAMGMRLLPIPQAHKISSVWIAYSANLWSDKLKGQNAANPKVMQQVNLASCGRHEFKPTAQALKAQVLECAISSYKVSSASNPKEKLPQDLDFPFESLAGKVEDLADSLTRAASCHPKTKGLELAVVLADPVGVAAELNSIRVRRKQLLDAELAKPENAHPLNSDAAVNGLKQVFLDSHSLNSFDKVSPLCTKAKFDASTWPAGTEWAPLTTEDRMQLDRLALGENFLQYVFLSPVRTVLERRDLGRAIYPDMEARAAAWASKEVEKSWSVLAPHVDEAARTKWKKAFAAQMKAAHGDPLLRYENDWLAATQAERTLQCFQLQFDPQDANGPGATKCGGEIYAAQSALIHQPAPYSAELQEAYLQQLDQPITSDKAVALRALVGNQQSLIELIHTQLSGDPGDTGMRDKTYDFLKGALGLNAGEKVLAKHAWIGPTVAGYATGYLSAASGAVMNATLSKVGAGGMSPKLQARLLKLQQWWGVQRVLELATGGALKGAKPAMPVLLHMEVDAARALEVLRARAGQATGGSRSYIKRQRRQGAKVRMSLLTDTDTLKAVQGDVQSALADPGTGSLKMGPQAKATTAGLGTLAVSEAQFLKLYAKEAKRGTQLVSALRESLHSGAGLHAKTIALSLPGRLALGSVLVQGLGLVNGLYALRNAGTEKEVRDAWYGIYDSTAGTLGGLLETWAVAREATKMAVAGAAAKAGADAAAKSLSIGALKVLGNLAGAAGGAVNGIGAWAKANEARNDGDVYVERLYFASSLAFWGISASGVAALAGAVANTLVARGVGGAVAEAIAVRVGATGVLATVGGTALTVSGIGLVLLGVGVAFQIGAVALTPTPLQRWLSRSYFGRDPSFFDWDGKRDDMFARGDWTSEFKAFQQAIENGGKPEGAAKPSIGEKAKQVMEL